MNLKIHLIVCIACLAGCSNSALRNAGRTTIQTIIPKENGKIILAYKTFDAFLDSDRSWETYENTFLNVYPEMRHVHQSQLNWGAIDPVRFPEDLKNYKREDFEGYFHQYDEKALSALYDSIIKKAHTLLPPVNPNPVDLCLFLPYGSCFVDVGEQKSTIYISLYINPNEVQKIMAHEYSHCLHSQRCPEEPLTLRREVVSEGMAVYLTTLIVENLELKDAIPFMPESSVDWCAEHEQQIKDSIHVELEDSTDQIFFRYISDGSIAAPPEGFVQKTAYYAGYRIIEACIEKGMTLEEICASDSKTIIDKSEYFLPRE